MTALLACLVVMAVTIYWAISELRKGASQEASYRQWVRRGRLVNKLVFGPRRLPAPLARPLDTWLTKEMGVHYTQEQAFRASGFLTNVCIPLRSASVQRSEAEAEIARRIHQAVPDNGFMPIRLGVAEDHDHLYAEITCRSKDIPRLRKVVEAY